MGSETTPYSFDAEGNVTSDSEGMGEDDPPRHAEGTVSAHETYDYILEMTGQDESWAYLLSKEEGSEDLLVFSESEKQVGRLTRNA